MNFKKIVIYNFLGKLHGMIFFEFEKFFKTEEEKEKFLKTGIRKTKHARARRNRV